MATSPGRNDRCPCGSGRKYKHCCLAARDDLDRQWREVREAEGRVIPELLGFALDHVGKRDIAGAWKFFCGGSVPFEEAPQDPDFEQLFVIWLLFDWQKPAAPSRFSRRRWPARPVAGDFLERRGLGLAPLEERVVRAALAAPFSFRVVETVTPGRSIGLRDILTGERHTVLERSASQAAQPGTILFVKVLTVGTVSIMLGAGHWLVPPMFHNRIIDLRQAWARGETMIDTHTLKVRHAELIEAYNAIIEKVVNPTLPKLQNTDGDPLAPTILEFELRCAQEEAVRKLATLAYGHEVDDILQSPDRDAAGRVEYVVPWIVPGNPMHPDWDNTSLGMIRVKAKRIEAEVNSERRAKRLMKAIERLLRDRVLFVRQETRGMEALLSQRPGPREARLAHEQEALQNDPEVRARLREMEARHWEVWVDQPVPALGGLTPREAAATPLGRERLEALLNEFEYRNDQRRPGERANLSRLRRTLGLDPDAV